VTCTNEWALSNAGSRSSHDAGRGGEKVVRQRHVVGILKAPALGLSPAAARLRMVVRILQAGGGGAFPSILLRRLRRFAKPG
jgi:hypothetical protein